MVRDRRPFALPGELSGGGGGVPGLEPPLAKGAGGGGAEGTEVPPAFPEGRGGEGGAVGGAGGTGTVDEFVVLPDCPE